MGHDRTAPPRRGTYSISVPFAVLVWLHPQACVPRVSAAAVCPAACKAVESWCSKAARLCTVVTTVVGHRLQDVAGCAGTLTGPPGCVRDPSPSLVQAMCMIISDLMSSWRFHVDCKANRMWSELTRMPIHRAAPPITLH